MPGIRMRKKDREDIVTLIRWHDKNIPLTESESIGTAMLALGGGEFPAENDLQARDIPDGNFGRLRRHALSAAGSAAG